MRETNRNFGAICLIILSINYQIIEALIMKEVSTNLINKINQILFL